MPKFKNIMPGIQEIFQNVNIIYTIGMKITWRRGPHSYAVIDNTTLIWTSASKNSFDPGRNDVSFSLAFKIKFHDVVFIVGQY